MTVRDTIAQAARSYLVSVTGLADGKVILVEQSGVIGPRPAKPYLTVKVGPIPREGQDERQDKWVSGITLTRHERGARRAFVSVQGFGIGADDYLEMARTGLALPKARAVFNSTAIEFQNAGPILNLTDMLDTSFEQQFSWDVEAYYLQDYTETLDTVDSIVVNGTLYDSTDHMHVSTTVTP